MSKDLKKKLFSLNSIVLLLIITAGAFFRFYNTPERYGFDQDPARDGVIAKFAAENLNIPLTGPHSGVGEFAFGPWYYYQLIAAEVLIPADFAPWIYLSIVSLVFVFIMYLIGKELGDNRLGLILAFFAALSPSITGPTSGLSNPNFIPFFTSLFILVTVKYLKYKNISYLWIFTWGASFALGLSHHYQMAGLIFLPLLTLFFKRENLHKIIPVFIAGILAMLLPTIIFEYLTGWYNTKGIWMYVTRGGEGIYVPNSWTIYIKDFWFQFFAYVAGVPQIIGIPLLFLGTAIIAYNTLKKKLNPYFLVIFLTLLINVVLLRFYPGQREYYYTLYLIPMLIVFIGYLFYTLLKIKLGTTIVLLILLVMAPFIFQEDWERLGTREDFIKIRGDANTLIDRYPENNISIYTCGKYPNNYVYGINYFLLKNANNSPVDNDKMIGFKGEECPDNNTYGSIEEIEGVELPENKEATLTEQRWKKVTPESIYSDTVNWWKND